MLKYNFNIIFIINLDSKQDITIHMESKSKTCAKAVETSRKLNVAIGVCAVKITYGTIVKFFCIANIFSATDNLTANICFVLNLICYYNMIRLSF